MKIKGKNKMDEEAIVIIFTEAQVQAYLKAMAEIEEVDEVDLLANFPGEGGTEKKRRPRIVVKDRQITTQMG
jgi:hypothetical protein